jgi:hypothetical protein
MPDGTEEIVSSEKGALCGVAGLEEDFVKMTSGNGKGGSSKKIESVFSKARMCR